MSEPDLEFFFEEEVMESKGSLEEAFEKMLEKYSDSDVQEQETGESAAAAPEGEAPLDSSGGDSPMSDSQFAAVFEAVMDKYPAVSSQELAESEERKKQGEHSPSLLLRCSFGRCFPSRGQTYSCRVGLVVIPSRTVFLSDEHFLASSERHFRKPHHIKWTRVNSVALSVGVIQTA